MAKTKRRNYYNDKPKQNYIIDVSDKEITVIGYYDGEITEEEKRREEERTKELYNIMDEMREKYYSSNRAVEAIYNRTFWDLVKIFFQRLKTSETKDG